MAILKYNAWLRRFPCTSRAYFLVVETTIQSDRHLEFSQWQAFQNAANPWTSTVGPGFTSSTYV